VLGEELSRRSKKERGEETQTKMETKKRRKRINLEEKKRKRKDTVRKRGRVREKERERSVVLLYILSLSFLSWGSRSRPCEGALFFSVLLFWLSTKPTACFRRSGSGKVPQSQLQSDKYSPAVW